MGPTGRQSSVLLACRVPFLELDHVSPRLAALSSTGLPVPASGAAAAPPFLVGSTAGPTLVSLVPQIRALGTKTRPKSLSLVGSDGQRYQFLLKVRSPSTTPPPQYIPVDLCSLLGMPSWLLNGPRTLPDLFRSLYHFPNYLSAGKCSADAGARPRGGRTCAWTSA
jgi:hypothetical protein